MLPEDYKPFPEHLDHGDYPDLEPSSMDSRSGFEMWDISTFKRNFSEPVRHNFYDTMDIG
jgi:hypothetical protein